MSDEQGFCVREDGGDGMWVRCSSVPMRVGDRLQPGNGVLMEVVGEDNGQWLVRDSGPSIAELRRMLG